MNSSNGNFLDEKGNPVNIVQLLKTGKAVPVENPGPGLHMAAHSGWFTDESGKPVNIIALIDAAIDEDGGDDEPAIGGISINGGNVVTPDANGIINLTISGDGSTVIDSELSASSTNPVQNKVITGEINSLNESVTELNGSLGDVKADLGDLKTTLNLLDSAVNVYENTAIDTTTGAKRENQTGKTLYVIPVEVGDVLYITQCSSVIKMVGLYSDADASTFVGFAYDNGFTLWNKTFTVPSGSEYIGIVVSNGYKETAFCGTYNNYLIWTESYRMTITEKAYIKELADLKDGVQNTESYISKSVNLFDFSRVSEWGWWCNYSTGAFQSNQSVVAYAYSDYIEVEPDTTYVRQHGTRGTVFFDENKIFISGVKTDVFTTPSNCKYVVIDISRGDTDYFYTMLLERETAISNSEPYIPYFYGFDIPKRDYITCGINGDYPTIKQGFEIATALDVDCVIMPGTYDLVSEGISGKGYILPKRTYGYGATLVCRLSAENWYLSPLNVSVYSTGAEVYGLTVICANCRYCIHDDMGAMVKQSYHNVFKDLHLIHESEVSATLLAPQCIGGGFGLEGSVDIENCIFEATIRDVSYHSASGGSQRKGCILRCKDSVFSHTYTSTNVGSSTAYVNRSYITNCLMESLPSTTPTANTQIIEWNNVVPT